MTGQDDCLLSVAPMMAVTDRNFRFMFRQLSKRTKLYTPMLVDDTLLHQAHRLEHYFGHEVKLTICSLQSCALVLFSTLTKL
jgi:tRNA-dihydrouridine synthase